MTFVGKVLVIVQVVLSLCFMAFAGAVYTVQQDWKTAFEQKVQDIERKNAELAQKEEEISLLNKDLAATQSIQQDIAGYVNNIDQLTGHIQDDGVRTQLRVIATRAENAETKAASLERQMEAKDKELMEAKDNYNRVKIENEYALKEAKERTEEAKKLKATNKDLNNQLAQAHDKIFTLEDLKFNLETEARGMADKHKGLLQQVAYVQEILRKANINEQEVLAKDEPPPLVRGLVYNTKAPQRTGGTELVEISIGSDDGLSEGHELDIYRTTNGGQYLGRMQVVFVQADRAVGKVIQKSKNGIIQRGDYVTTKL